MEIASVPDKSILIVARLLQRMITWQELSTWLESEEGSHLEIKEARDHFDFELLVKYCVALANEGGGKMILGVTDKKPRQIVGSRAFLDPERTKQGLIERLHLRVDVETFQHSAGPVLIVSVPGRPLGMPIHYKGAYWMRAGEALSPMTPDMLKSIFNESAPDFTSELCDASISDLNPTAIENFRSRWIRKSGNSDLAHLTNEQLLLDAELLTEGKLTYAALILFGTRSGLGRYLAQSEVIFEYRSSEVEVSCQQRTEFRQGFLSFSDDLWNLVNLRNDHQSYQDGLFRYDLPTFSESVVREAILNAVGHRDYRLGGSVFVKQFPRHMEIVSPGGFPAGITPENILDNQNPRNRRLAEALSKCGLIERSGQGMNRIFQDTIREGKGLPDFTDSDAHHVRLLLRGDIQNPDFLRYLERVGQERLSSFTTHDFLLLECVHREQPVPQRLRHRLARLLDLGLVESVGRGRGVRHILSAGFYIHLDQKGAYTRRRGLDRETNKELLCHHIRQNSANGTRLYELQQVLPTLSRDQLQTLLRELKRDERVSTLGHGVAARWFPGSEDNPSKTH